MGQITNNYGLIIAVEPPLVQLEKRENYNETLLSRSPSKTRH